MLDVHTVAVPTGRLARANPVAKLAAALVLGFGAALSDDAVTPAVLVLLVLLILAAGGITAVDILRRGWPLLVSAAGLGATTLLFGDSPTPLLTALTVTIRVVAVALPGVVVLLTVDPTDLADSLVQNARVPARFAYAALAALRLLPLMGAEWQTIKAARRARGIDAGRNPLRHLELFAGTVFALLVGAVRRGTRLALAMDARGFDATGPRTLARPQVVRQSDIALVVGAFVLLATAATVSIALGTFQPVWA
ncbi:MAG TPA: energy-coupling factor transporter transmembrane component T [Jiangellaceae bacterium]|nr:energy-coupling factor transporter transmembrane component T [Jiangellaceae bacterium]